MLAPTNFLEAQDVLAEELPGYHRRQHQIDLAAQINAARRAGKTLLGQAGCGTGKSFAAAIELILEEDTRSVIATPTKALQDQYERDFKFLAEHLGVDFLYAVLKGRSNYACHLKISQLEGKELTWTQRQILTALGKMDGDNPEVIIDREAVEATGIEIKDGDWRDFGMSTTDCPGKKSCPFGTSCMAERAKDKAQQAKIVITNLTYLLLDLMLREQSDNNVALLGDFDRLIIDEGHELYDKATDALSDTLGKSAFEYLTRDIEGFLHDQDRDYAVAGHIRQAATALWSRLDDKFWRANKQSDGTMKHDPVRMYLRDILGVGDQIVNLRDAITEARQAVLNVKGLDPYERDGILRGKLLRRTADWAGRVAKLIADQDYVRWLEEETKRNGEVVLNIRSAPLTPAPWLRRNVFEPFQTTVMSATLTTGKKDPFKFTRNQLGLQRSEIIEFTAGSPFDFTTQATLYVPPMNSPLPADPAWRTSAQTQTRMLVEAAGGNALLLYTSRSAMEDAWKNLSEGFADNGIRPLKQGDSSPAKLIAEFKKGNAVLFGLRTFFQGIDIQGQALKLVVIDKLPFAVPTDILHSARCDALNLAAGHQWAGMSEKTVPEMALVLVQGFGRLIRHANDSGLVAIMDPRLMGPNAQVKAKYGKTIREALPPAPVTNNIREAMEFLRNS